jgi:signal transduction histidine kinase
MITLVNLFLLISIGIVLVMIMLSGFIYLYEKDRRARHMVELWSSYGFYFVLSMLTNVNQPKIVALATLGWIWRYRVLRLLLEDITRQSLREKWHYVVIAAGFGISFVAGIFSENFLLYTLPTSVAFFIVGISLVWNSHKILGQRKKNPSHYAFLVSVFTIYFHMLNYGILRTNEEHTVLGFGIVLFTIFLTAVISPSLLLTELASDHAAHLERLVESRTQQLINQSKFSALGEMAAGIAHEINNPLAVISGKSSQLKRLVNAGIFEKEKFMQGLENIESTAFRISRIIKGLRHFSRNSEHTPFEMHSFDVVLNETLELCQERFYQNGVVLKINRSQEIFLSCRSIQLSQVLLNLLNNAFDAVIECEEKWVSVDVEEKNSQLLVSVCDSGKGISPELRDKIMMPFFTTKDVGKGTGLGLSISKGIIEEHGGNFYLDPSSENTCFKIELPLFHSAKQVS